MHDALFGIGTVVVFLGVPHRTDIHDDPHQFKDAFSEVGQASESTWHQ
jgi:hypothetical protein